MKRLLIALLLLVAVLPEVAHSAQGVAHRTVYTSALRRGVTADIGDSLTINGPAMASQGHGATASSSFEWTSGGTKIKVVVTQGDDELPSSFANRCKTAVAEMQAAFPPDTH